ncbi:glycosyl transferase family 2 [uncultured Algibacter sp.]|uniref:glycosyl transferase family 2 n=1 Tax=uncultured Algibacter sp. TaxID=298659 RepID=UPI0032180C24
MELVKGSIQKYDLTADNKVHLLYISPRLNPQGYYRMIAPAMELNKTQTHKAILTQIENNDFSNQFKDRITKLPESLLLWADYIIFPPIMDALKYLTLAIKTVNPNVQFVMDLDKNYFVSPKIKFFTKKLKKESLQVLEENIELMDLILVPTHSFERFLNSKLKHTSINTFCLPTAISKLALANNFSSKNRKANTSKIRIGFIQPTEEELLSLKAVILKTNRLFNEKIQWVCFGKPYESKEADLLLKEVACEVHASVSFSKYVEKLDSLNLNMVLLPAKESAYNFYKSSTIFLELAMIGVPVIASIFHSAKQLIKEEETGFLACEVNEWITVIHHLITHPELLEKMSTTLLKKSWDIHGFTKEHLNHFNEIFI